MSLHLDVYTRLNDSSLRSSSDRLHHDLERAGRDAGAASGRAFGEQFGRGMERGAPSAVKLEKATDKVADALGRVSIEQAKHNKLIGDGVKDQSRLVAQAERLAAAQRKHASAVREAVRAQQELHSSSVTLNQTLSLLGKSASSFGMAALAPTLAVAGGAAVAAAGSLALLPAAAGAAGAAFGTLKIATLGFGDAMDSVKDPEKFAEALQSLSPNAQQAALSIRQLMPAFDGLKNATQDSLFDGVAGQLQKLSDTLLPTIQNMTVGVSGAFNEMFMGVTDQLMAPETVAAITNVTTNITTAFQNLAPAAAPFTKAITEIMSVGSDFLPQLATAATNAATAFSRFITEASQSGQLRQWIADAGEILGQVGSIVWDVGRAFAALAPVAKDVLPYISGAVSGIADVLREHPGLIWGVVGAFTAWKTIEGVVALTSSLKTISNLLSIGLPDAARKGAPGVSKALESIRIPQVLLSLLALDVFKSAGEHIAENPDAFIYGRAHVGNPFATDRNSPPVQGPPSILPGTITGPLGGLPGAQAERRGGTASGPAPWQPLPVPTPTGNPGGPRLPDAPVVPYDPTLPPGMGAAQNAAMFGAQTSWLDARHNLAEKQARLAQLESTGVATAEDIQKARNDVLEAERDQQAAQLRLQEAQQSATDKYTKSLQGTTSQLGEIGAQLDSDFGISKGLAGIAENITKFVANLAFAPALGALSAVSAASPSKGGHGLMGILAAQGVFGEQFTGIDQQQQSPSALGPAAWQPTGMAPNLTGYPGGMAQPGGPKPGESARSFAHRVMMPFWESQGLTVGDHAADRFGEHQNGALDIMVPNIAEGNKVLQQVLSDPDVYGAIFNNQTFGYGQGSSPRPYGGGFTGNPTQDHQDHVHAWYKPGGGNNITPQYPAAYSPGTWAGPQGLPPGITGGGGQSPVFGASPAGPGVGGGVGYGAGGPGIGGGAGTRIGAAVSPPAGMGAGGIGITPGGTLDTAIGTAASMVPGAGQAAQTLVKLGNRAIQYGGQVAGIGAQGLMETFLPTGGSELAQNNWLTRIVGGLAGAAPTLPNVAGDKQPTPEQVANVDPNTQQGAQTINSGNTTNINVDSKNRDTGQGIANDIAYHQAAMNANPWW